VRTTRDGFGTVDFFSYVRQASLLRALEPEGRLTLDEHEYNLGGLSVTSNFSHGFTRAYLDRGLLILGTDTLKSWLYASHTLSSPTAPYPWVPGTRHSPPDLPWPPKGIRLSVKVRSFLVCSFWLFVTCLCALAISCQHLIRHLPRTRRWMFFFTTSFTTAFHSWPNGCLSCVAKCCRHGRLLPGSVRRGSLCVVRPQTNSCVLRRCRWKVWRSISIIRQLFWVSGIIRPLRAFMCKSISRMVLYGLPPFSSFSCGGCDGGGGRREACDLLLFVFVFCHPCRLIMSFAQAVS